MTRQVAIPRSSGNLIADKRFAYAEALHDEGDLVAAADLFEQVTHLVPAWAPAFVALGLSLETLNQFDAAFAALQRAERLDPHGTFGASLHLSRLRAAPVTEMPSAYVATLFDQYAHRFEAHLVGILGYRGPALIMNALNQVADGNTFARALDLGCGTGLMANALAGRVDALDGVDVSAQMIAKARATGLYEQLHVAECVSFLAAVPNNAYDLVLAADVFVYLGALEVVFSHCARVLTPGGRLAFTVQTGEDTTFGLGEDLRFSHSPAYIRRALDRTVLVPEQIEARSARRQGGLDVPGLVVVARAP